MLLQTCDETYFSLATFYCMFYSCLILITETHFKDNPGLSMLNDSDEEVHYG